MAEQGWDVTKPIDHTKVSVLPEETRGLRSSIKTVIQKEHVALGSANSGGQHLKGAARVYLGDAVPTTDPESNNLDTSATSDDGRIAVVTAAATDAENTLKVYIATAAGISTGWEDIRVAEAGTSHRVRLANAVSIRGYRATGVSTTISLIKVNASDLPEIGSGAAAIVMTSALPTASGQVANKDIVDTKEDTLVTQVTASTFGPRTFDDTEASTLVKATIYKAQCDGFLTVSQLTDANSYRIHIEQADTSPDVTIGYAIARSNVAATSTFVVRKDDYIQVEQYLGSANPTISFVPIGTGGLVDQT